MTISKTICDLCECDSKPIISFHIVAGNARISVDLCEPCAKNIDAMNLFETGRNIQRNRNLNKGIIDISLENPWLNGV